MKHDYIKIETFIQLKYHLDQGRAIWFEFLDGEACIQSKKNGFIMTIQPKYGSSTIVKGNYFNLKNAYEDMKDRVSFYVFEGTIESRSLSFRDKFADFIRSKKIIK